MTQSFPDGSQVLIVLRAPTMIMINAVLVGLKLYLKKKMQYMKVAAAVNVILLGLFGLNPNTPTFVDWIGFYLFAAYMQSKAAAPQTGDVQQPASQPMGMIRPMN